MSIVSVMTNAGMAVFTMNTLDGFSVNVRFWIYFGFQLICFLLQVTVGPGSALHYL
jgi:hypothetical protein